MRELIHHYGAWIVFALVFPESIGLPLPGEAILVSAAIFAGTTQDISIALVLLSAVLGAIFGSITGFWIGDRFGYPLLLRYGSYIGLTETRIRFKNDATADELREEIMRRLEVLTEAGILDLTALPAPKRPAN